MKDLQIAKAPGTLAASWIIARKDLAIEFRTRTAFLSALVFALLTVTYITLATAGHGGGHDEPAQPGVQRPQDLGGQVARQDVVPAEAVGEVSPATGSHRQHRHPHRHSHFHLFMDQLLRAVRHDRVDLHPAPRARGGRGRPRGGGARGGCWWCPPPPRRGPAGPLPESGFAV